MRRKLVHRLAPVVMLFTAAVGPAVAQGAGGSTPFDEAALHGDFASDGGCETQPGPGGRMSHFHRTYQFAPDRTWRMVRTFHGDPTCQSPLLILRLAGTYSLGQPSQAVAGAREAALSFDLIHVTLQNTAALPLLAGCGAGSSWEIGLEKDVGGTGCQGLGFKPLAECSVDHDIAQIRDDVLYPGVRPDQLGAMCTPAGRPMALQPTGARRVPG